MDVEAVGQLLQHGRHAPRPASQVGRGGGVGPAATPLQPATGPAAAGTRCSAVATPRSRTARSRSALRPDLAHVPARGASAAAAASSASTTAPSVTSSPSTTRSASAASADSGRLGHVEQQGRLPRHVAEAPGRSAPQLRSGVDEVGGRGVPAAGGGVQVIGGELHGCPPLPRRMPGWPSAMGAVDRHPQERHVPEGRPLRQCAGLEVRRRSTSTPTSGGPGSVASDESGLGEPDADLASGRLGAVGAVHQVLLHLEAPVATEVAADRPRAAAAVGSVAPASDRKPSMQRWPSTTIAATGPESMNSTSGS